MVELNHRFDAYTKMLKIAGVPLNDKLTLGYKIHRAVMITSGCLMLMLSVMFFVMNQEEKVDSSGTVRDTMSMVITVWLTFFTSLERTRIWEMLILSKEFVWEDLPMRDPETGSRTNAGMISLLNTLSPRGLFAGLFIHACQVSLKWLMGTKRPLLFSAWVPFDLKEFPVYLTVIIIQILGSVNLSFAFFGLVSFYIAFVLVICCQLEKAIMILHEIKYEENKYDPAMQEKFRKFVILHQKVIRFTNELQGLGGMTLLGPLVCTAISLCMSLYEVVKQAGGVANTMQIVNTLVIVLLTLFVLCNLGNELNVQTRRVMDAAWECNWVGAPVSFQKSVLIIMSANKEFTVTVGKVIPLSRSTALQVLNNTYSYLMLLLSLEDK